MTPPYSARALRSIATKARLVTTLELRAAAGLSLSRFTRARHSADFPPLIRHGRHFLIDTHAFAAWAHEQNRLAEALTLSQVCARVRFTRATVRAMVRSSTFPPPIGKFNGTARWDESAVSDWQRARLRGHAVSEISPRGGKLCG